MDGSETGARTQVRAELQLGMEGHWVESGSQASAIGSSSSIDKGGCVRIQVEPFLKGHRIQTMMGLNRQW